MAKKTLPSDESIDFTDIKAWIAEQEASPAPAPLTKLQRRAITELQNSIKAAAEPKVEDSIGETDWVSLLLSKFLSVAFSYCFKINNIH